MADKKKKGYDLEGAFDYSTMMDEQINQQEQPGGAEEPKDPPKKKRGRPKTTRVAEKGSQKGLQDGYTRKTFILRDDIIEKLDLIAWIKRDSLKNIMNEILEKYIEDFELDAIDDLLKEYEEKKKKV